MHGSSPAKASLEIVHENIETSEADGQVTCHFAYHQRIVLKPTAHEVKFLKMHIFVTSIRLQRALLIYAHPFSL